MLENWLLFQHAGSYTEEDMGRDIKVKTAWQVFKNGEVLSAGQNLFTQHGDYKLEQEAKAEWQKHGFDSIVSAKPKKFTEWIQNYSGAQRQRATERQVCGIVGRGAEGLEVLTSEQKAVQESGMLEDLTEVTAEQPKLQRGKSSANLGQQVAEEGDGTHASDDERDDTSDVEDVEDGEFEHHCFQS